MAEVSSGPAVCGSGFVEGSKGTAPIEGRSGDLIGRRRADEVGFLQGEGTQRIASRPHILR